MFAPWRSQKFVRKHKDPITGNSYENIVKISSLEVWEFNGLSLMPFGTLRIGERLRFWLRFLVRIISEIFFDTMESLGTRKFYIASWLPLLVWSALLIEVVLFCQN